jgi:hypothetical protein
MDKPLVGSGCVERSNSLCSMRALRCRLEPRRLTFPFPQFRRTDYELPKAMPCKPLVRRECVKRSNMQHVCRAYARTRGGTAIHVSSSPSRSSGALIGSCRASYARQATRENRVRETIQYACLALHARTSGSAAIHVPLPTVQAH